MRAGGIRGGQTYEAPGPRARVEDNPGHPFLVPSPSSTTLSIRGKVGEPSPKCGPSGPAARRRPLRARGPPRARVGPGKCRSATEREVIRNKTQANAPGALHGAAPPRGRPRAVRRCLDLTHFAKDREALGRGRSGTGRGRPTPQDTEVCAVRIGFG